MRPRFAKLLQTIRDPAHRLAMGAATAVGLVDFPVPPRSGLHKTSSLTVRHYYVSGLRTAMPLITAAGCFGLALRSGVRVLDFGCGVGRQLLHLTRDCPGPEYSACDVDETSVSYIRAAFPMVDARVTKFTPPLPYDDGRFDLVYSVSTFSHFNEADVSTWLRELARVTRAGGLCLVTTEGTTALRHLATAFNRPADALVEELATKGLLFKAYPDWEKWVDDARTFTQASPLVGIERAYGNTAISPAHIRKHWPAAGFEVLAVVEGIIDFRQDLVVLRRNA